MKALYYRNPARYLNVLFREEMNRDTVDRVLAYLRAASVKVPDVTDGEEYLAIRAVHSVSDRQDFESWQRKHTDLL